MSAGKCEWLIPVQFYPVKDNGDYVSHEAVCILNTGKEDAQIKFTLYFEDRPPGARILCDLPCERTHHVRLDRIKAENGDTIPKGVPYAIIVESNVPLSYSIAGVDTTQPELAFMGLLAY